MTDLEIVIKAVKEDPVRLAECLEENKTIDTKFLKDISNDPLFNSSVSLGCKAARIITLGLAK